MSSPISPAATSELDAGAEPVADQTRPKTVIRRRQNSLVAIRELISFSEVLQELVKRDLKVRYKRSVLGLMWTMLNPLLMMAITTIVFSNLFRTNIENFPIYMLSGYVVWGFFSQATSAAASSVLDNAALTRRIYVPPALFPLASIIAACVNLSVSFVPLLLLMILTSSTFSWALIVLPIAIVPVIMFAYGLGLMLAASSVFFHDTLYTYQVFLTAWMYLTPIFYPRSIIPAEWATLFELNPIFNFIEIVRAPIYYGRLPDISHILIGSGYALGVLVVGWRYFESSRRQFVSYL